MKKVHNINIHSGKLGLAFSGGADSAVLLYILAKNTNQPLHIYSFLSAAKRHIAEPITERVLSKCIELTGNQNIVHHKEYIEVQTPSIIYRIMQEKIVNDGLEIMYTGLTKLPPDNVIDKFNEKLAVDDPYVYNQRRDGVTRTEYFLENKFYRPFINLNRQDVKKIYEQLGIEKELFSVTRSCENIHSPDKHCGQCFWCQERLWGFGYLE